jgi:23S rRNA pseudouridine2605 synthase
VEEFAKDKRRRNRTVSVEAVTRSPRVGRDDAGERPEGAPRPERFDRPERPAGGGSYERTPRHSYNPNFSADNRFIGGNSDRSDRADRPDRGRPGGYRDNRGGPGFGSSSGGGFGGGGRDGAPERDFNRWDTPSDRPARSEYRPGEGYKKPYAPRPAGDRPYGDRPQGERSYNNDRAYNSDRPHGGPGGRSYGAGPGGGRPPAKKKPFVKKGPGGLDPGAKPEYYPSYTPTDVGGELRLNRFIAMSGKCSRREADELISKGEVTVNGAVVTEMGVKVQSTDKVCLKGEPLSNERKVYIIINKPKGFVTSLDDPHAEKTVMDIVRNACTERIYPVGRLDKSSVGVLLLTNDGDLTEKLTHPSHNKKKVYQVTLERPLTNMDLQKARDGIDLDDGVIIPDAVDFVKPDNRKEVGIEIHSGRNRIVRRIFEELGYGVHKLDRVYFAGLTKKNLRRGQWRFLTDKELAMLKSGRYE